MNRPKLNLLSAAVVAVLVLLILFIVSPFCAIYEVALMWGRVWSHFLDIVEEDLR